MTGEHAVLKNTDIYAENDKTGDDESASVINTEVEFTPEIEYEPVSESEDSAETDELILEYIYDYSEQAQKKYFYDISGEILTKGTKVSCIIAICAGIGLTILNKNFLMLLFGIAFAGIFFGHPYLMRLIKFKKFKKKSKKIWHGRAHIALYETHVLFENDIIEISIPYNDFYKVKKFENIIYMIAGNNKIIIVNSANIPAYIKEEILALNQ